MALSLKNTLISLSLSGLMVFTAYVSGGAPNTAIKASGASAQTGSSAVVAEEVSTRAKAAKKAKRSFTTPYFSFGRSNLPAGVR
jgi:hypothetical protein